MKATEARKKLKDMLKPRVVNAETIQTLINLGELERAQDELNKADKNQMWVWEKQGWVNELMGKYVEAEENFQKVLDQGLPDSQNYKTAIHFLGRAKFGLNKISEARKQFEQDLEKDVQKDNKFGQVFNLCWLAKCDLEEGKLPEATEKLAQIKHLMPDSKPFGIWAHTLILEGLIRIEENNLSAAREAFIQARKLWQRDDLYVRGAADALMELAVCDMLEGQSEEAAKKAHQAELEHKWVWVHLS